MTVTLLPQTPDPIPGQPPLSPELLLHLPYVQARLTQFLQAYGQHVGSGDGEPIVWGLYPDSLGYHVLFAPPLGAPIPSAQHIYLGPEGGAALAYGDYAPGEVSFDALIPYLTGVRPEPPVVQETAPAGRPHDFYKDGDVGIPSSILDQQEGGQVALSLCKVCGQAEGDLEPTCPGPKAAPLDAKATHEASQSFAEQLAPEVPLQAPAPASPPIQYHVPSTELPEPARTVFALHHLWELMEESLAPGAPQVVPAASLQPRALAVLKAFYAQYQTPFPDLLPAHEVYSFLCTQSKAKDFPKFPSQGLAVARNDDRASEGYAVLAQRLMHQPSVILIPRTELSPEVDAGYQLLRECQRLEAKDPARFFESESHAFVPTLRLLCTLQDLDFLVKPEFSTAYSPQQFAEFMKQHLQDGTVPELPDFAKPAWEYRQAFTPLRTGSMTVAERLTDFMAWLNQRGGFGYPIQFGAAHALPGSTPAAPAPSGLPQLQTAPGVPTPTDREEGDNREVTGEEVAYLLATNAVDPVSGDPFAFPPSLAHPAPPMPGETPKPAPAAPAVPAPVPQGLTTTAGAQTFGAPIAFTSAAPRPMNAQDTAAPVSIAQGPSVSPTSMQDFLGQSLTQTPALPGLQNVASNFENEVTNPPLAPAPAGLETVAQNFGDFVAAVPPPPAPQVLGLQPQMLDGAQETFDATAPPTDPQDRGTALFEAIHGKGYVEPTDSDPSFNQFGGLNHGNTQVLRSAAGFYIGSLYHDEQLGGWFPQDRDSDYFTTRQEAQTALDKQDAYEAEHAAQDMSEASTDEPSPTNPEAAEVLTPEATEELSVEGLSVDVTDFRKRLRDMVGLGEHYLLQQASPAFRKAYENGDPAALLELLGIQLPVAGSAGRTVVKSDASITEEEVERMAAFRDVLHEYPAKKKVLGWDALYGGGAFALTILARLHPTEFRAPEAGK